MSNTRSFLNVPIEGPISKGRNYENQRPMEELVPYFQNAFAKGIKAIAWTQYTPYFNDGDVCEFSVGDFSYTSNQTVADIWLAEMAGDEDDVYEYEDNDNGELRDEFLRTDFYGYENPWSEAYPHPDGFKRGDIELPSGIQFEQVLNETFGDHTTIVVTPTRVVQYEYSHE